jgi:putative ABC transport system permease protein
LARAKCTVAIADSPVAAGNFVRPGQRRDVLGMVLRQGAVLAGAGIAIGLGIGFAVNRVLASGFRQVVVVNPWLLAGAALLLGTVALVACYVPALRAARVDPMKALRYE